MDIGIAFDLKPASLPGEPDDLYEEFDAPTTVEAIAAALRHLGHTARLLGNGRELLTSLLATPPELVFNFAEGHGSLRSREARVPAICEMLAIPHTGSDPLTMAVALDKDMSRRLAQDAGAMVPRAMLLGPPRQPFAGNMSLFSGMLESAGLELPVIVKPAYEGSSKGIRATGLVTTEADFGPMIVALWNDYAQPVLVEEFIAGLEVTEVVIGNDPPAVFGIMAITPKVPTEQFVYSLEVKRNYLAEVDYQVPPPLPADVLEEIANSALAIVDALGVRDVARLDYRVRDGVPYFLELNPLPGLNPESSDLVIMARLMGVSHASLIERIVGATLARLGDTPPAR